jgi:hypothetical protein
MITHLVAFYFLARPSGQQAAEQTMRVRPNLLA